jgi:hypothetical protein
LRHPNLFAYQTTRILHVHRSSFIGKARNRMPQSTENPVRVNAFHEVAGSDSDLTGFESGNSRWTVCV